MAPQKIKAAERDSLINGRCSKAIYTGMPVDIALKANGSTP
jgi:hypothetical protein